jgi:hypothetical protein
VLALRHRAHVGEHDEGRVLHELHDVLGRREAVVRAAQHEVGEVVGADHARHVLQQRRPVGAAEVVVEQRAEQQRRRAGRGAGAQLDGDVHGLAAPGEVEHGTVDLVDGVVHVGPRGQPVAVGAGESVGHVLQGRLLLPGHEGDPPVSWEARARQVVSHAATLDENCSQ